MKPAILRPVLLVLCMIVPPFAGAGGQFRTETGGAYRGHAQGGGYWSGTVQPHGAGGYGFGYGYGGYGHPPAGYGGYGYGGYGRPPGYGWPGQAWPPSGYGGYPDGRRDWRSDRETRNYVGDPPDRDHRHDRYHHDRHRDDRYDSRREEPYYGAPSGRHRERRSSVGER